MPQRILVTGGEGLLIQVSCALAPRNLPLFSNRPLDCSAAEIGGRLIDINKLAAVNVTH
jgi:hypothetical protein